MTISNDPRRSGAEITGKHHGFSSPSQQGGWTGGSMQRAAETWSAQVERAFIKATEAQKIVAVSNMDRALAALGNTEAADTQAEDFGAKAHDILERQIREIATAFQPPKTAEGYTPERYDTRMAALDALHLAVVEIGAVPEAIARTRTPTVRSAKRRNR